MKILISADMEGATGVTWPADVEPGTGQWQRCRRMFTSDVNAAIAGFFDGGADEVLVNEAHATMRNLLLEELDTTNRGGGDAWERPAAEYVAAALADAGLDPVLLERTPGGRTWCRRDIRSTSSPVRQSLASTDGCCRAARPSSRPR